MSGMSMPPRQKMINMMYLVLTAMLALNVSKEVLDAFAVMDGELIRTEQAHQQRSAVEYALLAAAAERLPDKFRSANERAQQLKLQADPLVAHIDHIKAQAIAQADGLPLDAVRGTDAQGSDTLRALMTLGAKDDREVLTRMLVGSEPATPRRDPGGAYDLRLRITAFRDSLKAITGVKGEALNAALDHLFDLSDRRDASGTMNNWESTNFYDVPVAAGIATLSKIQTDIRSAENDVLKWLFRSVEMKDYKFGTLTTAVVPQNSFIMQGDSFRADVFLAAYDPRNRPKVTANGAAPLPIGSDGKAKLRLRGDRVGEHKVEGVIDFEGPDGPESIAYTTSYQVMAPLLVASPTKMNVLYRGVENPISLSVPGVPADQVKATITSGTISRKGDGWVATGITANAAEVNAVVQHADGSSRRIGPVTFRVKDLPPPIAYIAGTEPLASKAVKAKLTSSRGIIARPVDDLFGETWTVQRFALTVVRRSGSPIYLLATNNAFTEQMLEAMAGLRSGDQVYVGEIKARLSNGAGPVRDLPPIAIKVLP